VAYRRPESTVRLTKDQKRRLLARYFDHYQRLAEQQPASLNVKVSRDAYNDLLDQVGVLLLVASRDAAVGNGAIRKFLDANPLPDGLKELLPDDFRAFCLVLNALKQWVSAEQAATDRYLLGGTARQLCRQAAAACVLTGQPLDGQTVELHHPVRDGRPPIPVSRAGHAQIEGQAQASGADPHLETLRRLKREGNRSWVQLRLGCQALLAQPIASGSPKVLASAKTFARKAADLTGLTHAQLIAWLDANGF